MQTHIVPVGFDYDRLIAPLVRDQVDVDRVILLEGAVGSEANVEYSRNLSRKLETDFRNLLGAETDRFVLEDVYDYDEAFEQAFELITAELDGGNEVWVNVAAMPRTVSFAFAKANETVRGIALTFTQTSPPLSSSAFIRAYACSNAAP